MIKLSVGIAAVAGFLLLQAPPEPSAPVGDVPGPFANSGQLILAVLVLVVPVATRWFDKRAEAKRESEKEMRALKREAEKDELALKQRAMDESKAERQRQYDLEDRRDARADLERKLAHREDKVKQELTAEAAKIKRDLEDARIKLEKKVDETAAKADTITTLVDGAKSELLQKLADVKQLLAHETGLASDQASADDAQKQSDDQHARVKAAGREQVKKEEA